ncbi:MAG: 16S rRNA (uracil(1498)-N(3))-methyltransferase [Proteobacteria bacterium]|nr:16S rRNA (uracil(1498)-N(3))-methyltransferase [Pseudomonadota bacterium]
MLKHFYLSATLQTGQNLTLPPELQHRLHKVLRLGQGAAVAFFNGLLASQNGGIYTATITNPSCRTATIGAQLAATPAVSGPILAIGVPKREAWESALRQATELGASAIQPLKTAFCQVGKINTERAQSILIEAAEQSERLTIPTLLPLQTLESFLSTLNTPCAWAAERTPAQLTTLKPHHILIGPEGGFSPAEKSQLQAHPNIHPIALGPTILRTDTAVVATLAKYL